jgi:hypothetical protein
MLQLFMVYMIILPISMWMLIRTTLQLLHLVQLDIPTFPHLNQLEIHLSPLPFNNTALIINNKVKGRDKGWLISMEILRIQEGGYMVGLYRDRGVIVLVLPSPMGMLVPLTAMGMDKDTGMDTEEDTEVKRVFPLALCRWLQGWCRSTMVMEVARLIILQQWEVTGVEASQ